MTDSAPQQKFVGKTVKGFESGGAFAGVVRSMQKAMLAKKKAVKFKKSYGQTPSMGDGGGGIGG